MDLPTLLTGMAATQDLRRATAALVECKAAAHENGTMPRQPALDAFLAEVLSVPIPRPVLPDRDTARVRADALFASIIGDAARAGGATPR